MSREIKESDWKLLKQLHPVALERFSQRILSEIGMRFDAFHRKRLGENLNYLAHDFALRRGQLPEIVANGRKEAERILESIEGRHRISLQTREWVLPAKDTFAQDWIVANERKAHLATHVGRVSDSVTRQNATTTPVGLRDEIANPTYTSDAAWNNRLIYGDNLLADDEQTPSLRGKVGLIYIDPPSDSRPTTAPRLCSPLLPEEGARCWCWPIRPTSSPAQPR